MRPLTQTERAEIRKLIKSQCQKAVDLILAQHPRLAEQLDKQVTAEAVKLLGVEKLVKQKETLEKQKQELENALEIVEKQIRDKMPKQKEKYRGSCPYPMDLCEAVGEKKELLLPAHQAKNATYKRILKLEQARDEKLRLLEKVCGRDQLGGVLD